MAYLFNDDKSKEYIDDKWVLLPSINFLVGGFSVKGKVLYKKFGEDVTLKFDLNVEGDVPAGSKMILFVKADIPDEIRPKDNSEGFSFLLQSPIFMITENYDVSSKRCAFAFTNVGLRLIFLDKMDYTDSSNPSIALPHHIVNEWKYSVRGA